MNGHWSLDGIAEGFWQVRTAADRDDHDHDQERSMVPDPAPANAHPG
jgi:hypothetical protein